MIGIIGGSSLQALPGLKIERKAVIRTPFGTPSAPVIYGALNGHSLAFLARHGLQHTIPPHVINYRANIWALHHIGCKEVFAFSAMCSIVPDINIGAIVIPDQLIDYTWNRQTTFFNSQIDTVHYTEFDEPYAAATRDKLIAIAKQQHCGYQGHGVYGVTQGPRYETKAEIHRYRNDGCQLLGMTGMPEAALAQEIGLDYAVCGLVTKQFTGDAPTKHLCNNKNHSGNTGEIFSAFLSQLLRAQSV